MEARKLSAPPLRPFEISLRIRHPSIDPAVISRELELKPEHCFRAGEPRNSSSGLAATAVHAESYWFCSIDPFAWSSLASDVDTVPETRDRIGAAQMRSLEVALAICTTRLLRRHETFLGRIAAEGGQIGLLVEVSPEALRSFIIPPSIGRAMGELGIALEFEIESDSGG